MTVSTSGNAPAAPDPPQLTEADTFSLHLAWQKRPGDEEFVLQMDDSATVSRGDSNQVCSRKSSLLCRVTASFLCAMAGNSHGSVQSYVTARTTIFEYANLRSPIEWSCLWFSSFQLRAINEDGESPWSEVVTYRTKPDKPSPPGKPYPKGRIHTTSVKLAWGEFRYVFTGSLS